MKYPDKLEFITKNHFGEWLAERRQVEDELSAKNPFFCVCGRLATGFHEMNCRRFQDKVSKETIKRLTYLITVKKHETAAEANI